MTQISIPYTDLVTVGTELKTVSDALSGDSRAAYDVDGLTDPDQNPIKDAISGFRDEWEASVKKLAENIGTFGVLSGQIGSTVGTFDQQTADAFKGGGGGGGNGPGGNVPV